MFIGDLGAGKSCVLRRLAHNKFDDDYVTTETFKHEDKVLKIGEKSINLKLLDTPGFLRDRKGVLERMPKAQLIVFVYDSTDLDSFSKIKDFVKECPAASDNNQIWTMVGNKSELPKDYLKVKKKDADEYAKSKGMMNEMVSCSSGLNFKKFFKETVLPSCITKYCA